MQTVIYARRSAESGDDYSLTTQVEACQRYAAARGLSDVTVVRGASEPGSEASGL